MLFIFQHRPSRKLSFSLNHPFDTFQSTMVGSSYVAVEDDGTVIFRHNKL